MHTKNLLIQIFQNQFPIFFTIGMSRGACARREAKDVGSGGGCESGVVQKQRVCKSSLLVLVSKEVVCHAVVYEEEATGVSEELRPTVGLGARVRMLGYVRG